MTRNWSCCSIHVDPKVRYMPADRYARAPGGGARAGRVRFTANAGSGGPSLVAQRVIALRASATWFSETEG